MYFAGSLCHRHGKHSLSRCLPFVLYGSSWAKQFLSARAVEVCTQTSCVSSSPDQHVTMQIYGVIGNPVSHSRSPQLHNAALAAAGLDSVYLPLLVDNLRSFLKTYSSSDYRGFSVTIPHKVSCHAVERELCILGAPVCDCCLAASFMHSLHYTCFSP